MVLAVPDEKDPIAEMLVVDDEQLRGREQPEVEVNVDPPADKPAPERDESGKFKGKEEKKDEPKVEAEKKPEPEKKNDHVPLAKYLEEKNKLREELSQRDLTINEFKQKLAALEARLPKSEEPKEPDFVEDPKGYVDHKLSKTLSAIEEHNKKVEETGKKAEETAAQASQQVQVQRFMTDLNAHEQRFVQANPDYHDALNHVRNVRRAQLREFNPEVTDAQIREIINGEEMNLAIQLAQQGRDPVQTAYNLAKHYGYVKKEAKVELPDTSAKKLPPDQTLGSGSSDAVKEEEDHDNPIDQALASLFKKRA